MIEAVFITVVLVSIVFFKLGVQNSTGFVLFQSAWLVAMGILSSLGFFQNTNSLPPRIILAILPTVFYTIYFYRKLKSTNIKDDYLLLIHTLRIPVELILYSLFIQGIIPELMTFEGWNFDIFMGIIAMLFILIRLVKRTSLSPVLMISWNILGITFLTIIVLIAILSTPSPLQQLAFDQPNRAILQFPFIFLPSTVVPIVYLSHFLSLNKEIKRYRSQ